MTAGLTSLSVRTSPSSRCLLQRASSQLHVVHIHTSNSSSSSSQPPSSPSPLSSLPSSSSPMLGKANEKFVANGASSSRNALSKQLFPSSSPTPQAGDIREQLKKSGLAGSATGKETMSQLARTSISAFVRPLGNREANSTRPGLGGDGNGARQGSLASLYNNKADPFKHNAAVVDLTSSEAESKAKQAVYFTEDDFSDNDNLDLDFEAPSAFPSLPPPKPAAKENFLPPPPPPPESSANESNIPWSSSPTSHYFQKKSQPVSASTFEPRLKRESPSENDPFDGPANKKVKKRVLPASFRQQDSNLAEDDDAAVISTPPAKAKNIWDQTASAIKEQKKQLKNQRQATLPPEEKPAEFGKTHNAKNEAISLSSEQEHVLDLVVNQNKSVFFTGPAGTGKSVLMRAIINKMRTKFARDPERVAVTASTGLAACNIGGITLHSFSGIGLGKEDAPALVKKIRRNPKAKNRWLKTRCLIIDEISMVDGELFDKLSQIGRTIRNNGRPWGGIQIIVTGDFFQLPPVPDGDKKREVKFAFDASTWSISIDHTIGLTQVFRQRDPEFANMLNEMRLGKISDATTTAFKALSRPLRFEDGVEGAELFPTRQQVESSNERKLRELPGKAYRYDAHDTGDPVIRDKLLMNMMSPKSLELKINAQVMLIKNLDESLVNGTLGKVIAFSDERTFDMTSADSYENDAMMEDAMARARKKLKAYSYETDSSSSAQKFPVVQFVATDGVPRVILCQPEEWKVELPNGEVQAKRTQLPLILAWALSIHKAQGQTLERVTVNLGKVFEKGQAYVALSRATSQEGLRVIGFEKSKVMAHPKVIHFYQQLYSAEEALVKKTSAVITDVPKKPAQVIDLDDDEEALASYGY